MEETLKEIYFFLEQMNKEYHVGMRRVFNHSSWPILLTAMYLQRVCNLENIPLKTYRDIHFNEVPSMYTFGVLCNSYPPLMECTCKHGQKSTVKLTKHGIDVADVCWKYLNFLSKGKLDNYVNKFISNKKKSLDIPTDIKDEEEEYLTKLEDNKRIAMEKEETLRNGIPPSPIKIDLDKIEVK